ncbi:response regulator [Paracoccaceae bacterium GXU_MW_L88]
MSDSLLPRPSLARPLNGISILLVEDSRCYAETIHQMALKSGARLCKVNTLEAGRKALRSFRPHVVIADLGLPDGDGLEIATLLAEQAAARPKLVAISGASADRLTETAQTPGVDAVVAKADLTLSHFRQMIGQLVGRTPPERSRETKITPCPTTVAVDLRQAKRILRSAIDSGAPAQIREAGQFTAALAKLIGDRDLLTHAERAAFQRNKMSCQTLLKEISKRLPMVEPAE